MERKEAIQIIKNNWPSNRHMLSEALKFLIPELEESEDEKIRKWLICYFKDVCDNVSEKEKKGVLAWLEKQGEQKPVKEHDICDTCDEKASCVIPCTIKLIDQKPDDKVEPKFHKGDWIVDGIYTVYQIKEIKEDRYLLQFYNSHDIISSKISTVDNDCHLWTIDDAMAGDVLFLSTTASSDIFIFKEVGEDNMVNCYCAYDSEDGFREGKYHFIGSKNNKYHPATQVQRDTLMKAMTDAGYTFDFDKKELKKIEQKPAWSEEDEKMLSNIVDCIKNLPIFYESININGEDKITEGFICDVINWLKSLKPEKQWKPSDEQIDVVKHIIDHVPLSARDKSTLYDLYLDLKRLTNYE